MKLFKLRHLIKITMNCLDINCWNFSCFFFKYVYKFVEVICTDLHIFQKVYPFIKTIQIPYPKSLRQKYWSRLKWRREQYWQWFTKVYLQLYHGDVLRNVVLLRSTKARSVSYTAISPLFTIYSVPVVVMNTFVRNIWF